MAVQNDTLYCGFKLDGDEYAIAVKDIQEIIKPSFLTCIPLAPHHIHGLVNLRGQIVTCLSLRELLGLESKLGEKFMNIIIKGSDGLYSLMVDEVTDIMNVDLAELYDMPNNLNERLRKLAHSVYKDNDKLIVLLNTKRILNQDHKMIQRESFKEGVA